MVISYKYPINIIKKAPKSLKYQIWCRPRPQRPRAPGLQPLAPVLSGAEVLRGRGSWPSTWEGSHYRSTALGTAGGWHQIPRLCGWHWEGEKMLEDVGCGPNFGSIKDGESSPAIKTFIGSIYIYMYDIHIHIHIHIYIYSCSIVSGSFPLWEWVLWSWCSIMMFSGILATLHSAFFFQAAVCETAIPSDSWMHQIRQIVAIPLIRLGIKPQRPWFHTV